MAFKLRDTPVGTRFNDVITCDDTDGENIAIVTLENGTRLCVVEGPPRKVTRPWPVLYDPSVYPIKTVTNWTALVRGYIEELGSAEQIELMERRAGPGGIGGAIRFHGDLALGVPPCLIYRTRITPMISCHHLFTSPVESFLPVASRAELPA